MGLNAGKPTPFSPTRSSGQAKRMVLALGIARDLGADHSRRIAVVARPTHAADGMPVDPLDLERAGAGAVVRTDGGGDIERHGAQPFRFDRERKL
jgi:hypothetical protein